MGSHKATRMGDQTTIVKKGCQGQSSANAEKFTSSDAQPQIQIVNQSINANGFVRAPKVNGIGVSVIVKGPR